MGDEGGRERRKEAKLTGRKEKLGAIHAADTLVGYDATWRCWKSLPGIPGIRKKILGNEIACRGFHEIPPRRRSNMRPNKEGRVDAFLIFIRMRDTPAGSPVPETRSPERKASPPPLLPLHIIPTTYSKNVNYPGKYFNFSSKGGGQRLAGSNLEELEAKFYPISLHGEREDKEGKGEVRRPFDTRIHPSVDVYPNVILIAHIMHSTRTEERRGGGGRGGKSL